MPSYKRLTPASPRASKAARGSSKKQSTRPEARLRQALWRAGLRYRKNVTGLPGRPDLAFHSARVAVFCDGDFWHGKDWPTRRTKLAAGHNAAYWIAKIESNIARDLRVSDELADMGWMVLRVWESDIRCHLEVVVERVKGAVHNINALARLPNPDADQFG